MPKLTQKQLIILIGGGGLAVLAVGFIIANLRPTGSSITVNLEVWGTDEPGVWEDLTGGYAPAGANASVKYRSFQEGEYESALLNALAAGEGPDIFMIQNTSVPRQRAKLAPADPLQFNQAGLEELFPTVVEQDFVNEGQTYALPLYIDTLALIYNKDLFDQAGIVQPPKNWIELQNMAPAIRSLGSRGEILRAASALGGSERSVNSAADILSLLMLQNEVPMVDRDRSAADFSGGLGALSYYLQFANAGSPFYTWNDSQPLSIDAFAAGKAAALIDFRESFAAIRAKSPFMRISVAPAPQPFASDKILTYARYKGLAVSKQSKQSGWAWDFIIYATTNADASRAYLASTGRTPALRSLVGEEISNPATGVFARQALAARSWYQADDLKVRQIFNNAITNVLSGRLTAERALQEAQDQVSQLMRAGDR